MPTDSELYADVAANPTIEKACFDYLADQHVTLWANWEIQQESRRRIAAGWFALQWVGVLEEMRMKDLAKALAESRMARFNRWLQRTAERAREVGRGVRRGLNQATHRATEGSDRRRRGRSPGTTL